MSKEVTDFSEKVADKGTAYELRETDSQVCPGTYTDGKVLTPLGYVIVYAQGNHPEAPAITENDEGYTIFRFAYEGRLYTRRIPKRLGLRGIPIMAYKFAKEVAKKKG